jgi:hypothetical protein
MEKLISRRSWHRVLFVALLFVLLALIGSCVSKEKIAKKEEDIAYRYWRDNPDKLAQEYAHRFPIIAKPGVPVINRDTITKQITDTVYRDSIREIRVETTKFIVNNVRVTDTIPDKALVESLMEERFREERKRIVAETKLAEKIEDNKVLWDWIKGLGASLLLFIGGAGVFVYKKISGGIL